jgi:hypothetical protein
MTLGVKDPVLKIPKVNRPLGVPDPAGKYIPSKTMTSDCDINPIFILALPNRWKLGTGQNIVRAFSTYWLFPNLFNIAFAGFLYIQSRRFPVYTLYCESQFYSIISQTSECVDAGAATRVRSTWCCTAYPGCWWRRPVSSASSSLQACTNSHGRRPTYMSSLTTDWKQPGRYCSVI